MDNQKQVEQVLILLEENLRHGNFQTVDYWLDSTDLESLCDAAILAALSITYWGKESLSRRDAFLKRAEIVLKKNLGEERSEKLLVRRR